MMGKVILLGSTQNKTRTLWLTASCIFPATVGPMRNVSMPSHNLHAPSKDN